MIGGLLSIQAATIGTRPNLAHPSAQGLRAFWPMWENSGLKSEELLASMPLTLAHGANWMPGYKAGIACNAVNSNANSAAVPASWTSWNLPVTIVTSARALGVQVGGGCNWGLLRANSANSRNEMGSYWLSGLLYVVYNATQPATAFSPAIGVDTTIAVTQSSGHVMAYANGAQIYVNNSASTGWGMTSTGYMNFASTGSDSNADNVLFYWGAVFNRGMAAAEMAYLTSGPGVLPQILGYPNIMLKSSGTVATRVRRTLYARCGSRGGY